MNNIFDKINNIEKLNEEAKNKAIKYQNTLAKPPRSLGVLEDLSIQLAGITGNVKNNIDRTCLLVFASDNGVVKENVSSAPQSVTLAQTINLTNHLTGASVLAKEFNTEIKVIDVGVVGNTNNGKVIQRKIKESTNNIYNEQAMTTEEAIKALTIGFEIVEEEKDNFDCFGIGEMGIGNTTTSSAILSVLLDLDVCEVTGKGGGLTDSAYLHKIEVIKHSININKPNKNDILDVISKLGGFDIVAMAGAYLACAYYHKPVVIDGFISAVSALIANCFNENAKYYMIPSHESYEIGYKKALDKLNLKPMLLLNMRLGEGSGCPLAFQILKASCAIMNNMASFEKASINDDYLEEIRQGDKFSVK